MRVSALIGNWEQDKIQKTAKNDSVRTWWFDYIWKLSTFQEVSYIMSLERNVDDYLM